ncbi:GNAT family N-acetyltransferase [Nocardia sp. alder85J]|uniref:GNAT family N-acetyltransferase n=1 Tax=Nocardia sp. alder85J TaxID=2862949 RepID=UPI001CD2FAE3|nr:GNAT family N-acetyltransferase [Nocardia sp. alder85J]MCX4096951.1 GNAT family N-acetyltransferase [Nocardia sp. alder85J]
MTIEIRTLTDPAEVRSAAAIFRTAMVGLPPISADVADGLVEPGRTLGAWLDGELVGGADSYTSRMVAPGGQWLPHAAVTHVGVLPTHTRRGVVSALLRHQLAEVAARGEIVASLRATQGGIYERFGYGVASVSATVELDRRRARLRDTVPPGGPVRYLDAGARWDALPKIYATGGFSWTGAIDRPEYWWRLQELVAAGGGWTVVHGEPGAEDGFLRYRPADADGWPRQPQRTVVVDDFVATTPAAYRGLLRHLLAHDIVDRIVFTFMPVDSPLRYLFTDERAVTVTGVADETWLRLVDVPAALERRGYRAAPPVVVAVTDPILPANTGHYRITGEGAIRTGDPADLGIDVASLAAVYLGGTGWRQLALAGRATELRPGALDAAEDLFATVARPFGGTFF